MTAQRFLSEHIHANALDAASSPFKTARDHIFAEADRFDLILVADVLYDRANLPLLDQFLTRGREALVADSRVRDFQHPEYQRLAILDALTLPDLAEPWEFRKVSLYHSRRQPL